MNSDTNPLQERIARALYENAEYYGPEDAQPPWDSRDDEERGEWMEIAAAVLPIIRKAERDAAREALGSLQNFARECMDGEHGEIDHETFAGWHHTWAAAMQHRATHYPHPEETP